MGVCLRPNVFRKVWCGVLGFATHEMRANFATRHRSFFVYARTQHGSRERNWCAKCLIARIQTQFMSDVSSLYLCRCRHTARMIYMHNMYDNLASGAFCQPSEYLLCAAERINRATNNATNARNCVKVVFPPGGWLSVACSISTPALERI